MMEVSLNSREGENKEAEKMRMTVTLQGSRKSLDEVLKKLLRDGRIRVVFVSWDIGERGHKEVASK